MEQDQNPPVRRTRRHVELRIEPDRLVLRLPRFGLSLLLGVSVFVFCCALSFVPPPAASHRHAPLSQELPGGGRLALTPLVEFDDGGKTDWRKLAPGVLPWAGMLLGYLVFFSSYRMFRWRLVLDRRANTVQRNGRPLCALSEIVGIELDDAPRIYVMNELALILPYKRRVSLLQFDYPVDAAFREILDLVAAYARVPIRPGPGRPTLRGRPKG